MIKDSGYDVREIKMLSNFYKELFAPILSLFTSLSTLVCCALPALLVTVGLGTTLVSIVSIFPWIVVLSKYKLYIFILAVLCWLYHIIWHGKEIILHVQQTQQKLKYV